MLRDIQQIIQPLLQLIDEPIFFCNDDFRIKAFNRSAEKLFGESQSLFDKNFFELPIA